MYKLTKQDILTIYQKAAEDLEEMRIMHPSICKKVMQYIAKSDTALFDKLNDMAENTTFKCRKYGRNSMTYPYHKEIGQGNPWPSTRYPKSSLCFSYALELLA